MNQNTPEQNVEIARLYDMSRKTISDSVVGEGERKSRFRQTFVVINASMLEDDNLSKDKVALYDEVFKMVAVDLRAGFDLPSLSLEEFDHQARYWLTLQIERFYTGEHPWCLQLKDNPEWVAVLSFGYGAVPSEGGKEYGLLPFAQVQLTRYEGEEGVVMGVEQWSLEKNGLHPNAEQLKQFGRPDSEA